MGKGEETRASILGEGMEVAATEGLEAITIGRLADRVGMSKSGLFAHFRSKEALQVAVLEHGRESFIHSVIEPAMSAARGEPRLRDLMDRWLRWNWTANESSGCLFLQASAEFDDRPGPVRDALVTIERGLLEFLQRTATLCAEEGHIAANTDGDQFAFELFALVMAHHFHTRLLRDPDAQAKTRRGLDRLIESYR